MKLSVLRNEFIFSLAIVIVITVAGIIGAAVITASGLNDAAARGGVGLAVFASICVPCLFALARLFQPQRRLRLTARQGRTAPLARLVSGRTGGMRRSRRPGLGPKVR